MKKLFTAAAVAALGFTSAGCATQGAGAASVPAGHFAAPLKVEAGETYLLQGDVSGTSTTMGEAINTEVGYTLAMEVIEGPSAGSGGVWRWSFEDLSLKSISFPEEVSEQIPDVTGPELDQVTSALMRLTTDIDFECRVDLTGGCVEMTNWPDWRERVENVALIASGVLTLASRFETPKANGEPTPRDIAKAINDVAGVLLDGIDNGAAASFMAMPMVTGVQGQVLRRGEATNFESLLALPYGADPLRYTGEITLESVDRAAGIATYVRTATIDSEALKDSLTSMLETLTPQIVTAIEPALPSDADDPAASARMLVAMATGLISTLDLTYQESTRARVSLATGLVEDGRTEFAYSVAGPDGTSFVDAEGTFTFRFVEGEPPRPRLGVNAARASE